LTGGPEEQLRRGHRLVHLGPNRLLEWLPRPCAGRTAPSDPCAGSDFNVWSYSLEASAALDLQIVSSGFWPDLGDESDIAADGEHLFVWTRAIGRLRSYAIDPGLADPLGQSPVADSPANAQLASQDWDPPTSAPAIKHLLVILQDGRSFDSYFGRYCQSSPGTGTPPTCTAGAACCEAIPAAIPGTSACTDPESDTSYQPDGSPECLRAKMGVAMEGFAIAHPPEACGDPRDFACAAAGAGPGGAAIYQALAAGGALADRYFQTYAFEDGVAATSEPDPLIENLLYLVSSRFAAFPPSLIDSPLLTKELVRLQVAWAIYAGPIDLPQLAAFGVPIYYDPDWFPFRSLNGGELEHDIAVGALPAVAVVLPDRGDPARSEAPGQPFDPGIAYVQSLVKAIAASPYQDDTLVLVTHLTAGGFYDHVPPPLPPPLKVDASSGVLAQATAIHYGPRVPFLALGKFARSGTVSHVQLELSSVTKFVEWNWMHGLALKGSREGNDLRSYRDIAVSNLGSLIDGTAAGIDVPAGAD
jgi:phospholipase C